MILHIFNNQKKFSVGYFQFLKDNGVSFDDTLVYHYGKKIDAFDEMGLKVKYLKNWFLPMGHSQLYKDMLRAERIIVHCLASPYLLWFLYINPELCKKVYWIVWGKDLYIYHIAKHKTPWLLLYEAFRRPVIKRIGHVVSMYEEEYDLVKKWYHNEGEVIYVRMFYPYCLKSENKNASAPKVKKEGDKLCVLLGNSASKTNEHIDAIDILSKNPDILDKVYCPLSYAGSRMHANKVRKYGLAKLKDKFKPLMEFMPLDEYDRIWAEADIAVFNQRRQEATGNIYSLIMQKKTIYLRPVTTPWMFFKRVGIKIGEFSEDAVLTTFDQATLEENARIFNSIFNHEDCINAWKRVIGQ